MQNVWVEQPCVVNSENFLLQRVHPDKEFQGYSFKNLHARVRFYDIPPCVRSTKILENQLYEVTHSHMILTRFHQITSQHL